VRVPLIDLAAQHAAIRDEVMAAAEGVIDSQAFILGEPVARFEETLARLAGAKHAIGVASGTDALVLALRATGVGAGDAVVTTPFTFVATAEAIVAVGARPLFADVEARTMTLDPASVEHRIKRARATGTRVRAVLPVHLFGQCADMSGLSEVARAHELVLVEDAAQAIGARCSLGAAGGIGDAGCFSFFPTKNLGAWGDAGAVVTSDARVAERVRRLRVHGIGADGQSAEPGMNSRLDALQAAVLGAKARHLDAWTSARRAVAARYGDGLGGISGLELPHARAGGLHAYNQYVVRTPRRDALAAHLAGRGVATRAYYACPVHRHAAYRGYVETEKLTNAEAASRTSLALPMYAELGEAEQAYVVDAIRAFYS
jgi:dTDP-4-amino-4,6-dideoxygalactose transaminase